MLRSIIVAALFLVCCPSLASAQKYPDKIRGYKVYETQIAIRSSETQADAQTQTVYLRVFDPEIESIGLSGVEISFRASAAGIEQAGRIDSITFSDLRVNGISASVAEYTGPLPVKRGELIILTDPLRSTVGLGGLATAGYRELTDAKKQWKVTGTMFVFGKFKRFGIGFKRVIPIKLDLTIENPFVRSTKLLISKQLR